MAHELNEPLTEPVLRLSAPPNRWTKVTPPGLKEWARVSMIEASRFDADTAYIAVDAHKLDDMTPYIYRTHDRGRTWTPITNGLSAPSHLWAVREDPKRKGLLYAGTENGIFVSFDDGDHWQTLKLNVWYSAGLISVFLILASLAVFLQYGWGGLFKYPGFNVTIAAIVFAMGLSFLGVWLFYLTRQDCYDEHETRVLGLSRLLNRTQEQLAMLRGMSNGLAALFTSLAGLTVLMLAIPLVSDGKIEGVYLALLPLTAIASFEAVQPLSLALQQLEASQAAGRRLFELIDTPAEVHDPAQPDVQPADTGHARAVTDVVRQALRLERQLWGFA